MAERGRRSTIAYPHAAAAGLDWVERPAQGLVDNEIGRHLAHQPARPRSGPRRSPDGQSVPSTPGPVIVRFYTDPATGRPHIYGHQVDEDEVEDVLERPAEDRPGREGSRVAVGQTRAGRYLRVIYVPDPEPDSVFVITAYELRGKPLAACRRRRRRRYR